MRQRRTLLIVAWVVLGAVWAASKGAAQEAGGEVPNCAAAARLDALGAPLLRTGGLIAGEKGITILATGSSSTQGVGASSPAMSYPSRLEHELHAIFPNLVITVINRGLRGQDVNEELARLKQDLADQRPDLVIWQVGTNALLRHQDPAIVERLIAEGVGEIKHQGIDVVLMDLQYAPRVLARDWPEMERVIAAAAHREQAGYFRRFEIMREWFQSGQARPFALIGTDGLHMTDVSYACLAQQLAHALAEQWRSQTKLVRSPNRNPAALAHTGQRGGETSAP